MPRRKYISNDLREANVAAHQSGKGYKAISKLCAVHHSTERKIIHMFTPRSDRSMLRETAKYPRATSQTLQASVSMLKVKVHDSTIRKRLNKYGLFGRFAGESLFSLKRAGQHSLGL